MSWIKHVHLDATIQSTWTFMDAYKYKLLCLCFSSWYQLLTSKSFGCYSSFKNLSPFWNVAVFFSLPFCLIILQKKKTTYFSMVWQYSHILYSYFPVIFTYMRPFLYASNAFENSNLLLRWRCMAWLLVISPQLSSLTPYWVDAVLCGQ